VLVTGGGNRLGRAFAEHFLAKAKVSDIHDFLLTLNPYVSVSSSPFLDLNATIWSNVTTQKVIIAGRTASKLQQTASEVSNPRLHVMELDVGDVGSLAIFVSRLLEEHDELDCLMNSAGIMEPLDLHSPGLDVDAALAKADAEVDVNVRGVVHLMVRLLPQLRKQRGTVMDVNSHKGICAQLDVVPAHASCFQVNRDSELGEKQVVGARPNTRYFGGRASSSFMGSIRLIQTY
jgi:short-subunit dehydrogenase involved in D-alanine esterification of teichoic acids